MQFKKKTKLIMPQTLREIPFISKTYVYERTNATQLFHKNSDSYVPLHACGQVVVGLRRSRY